MNVEGGCANLLKGVAGLSEGVCREVVAAGVVSFVLARFGTRGQLHLESRALTELRLDPDAAAVHLHDLLGDGKSQTGAALGLSKGAIDLMELFEDTRLLGGRNAGTSVRDADVEAAVGRLCGDA